MRLGDFSYWAFMASWLFALVAVARVAVDAAGGKPPLEPWPLGSLGIALIGFAIAWATAARADNMMSDVFSSYWQRNQPHLRAALKRARRRPEWT